MAVTAIDDAPLSGFHKRMAIYAAGGPFLDGYILAIIGIALVQIKPQFGLSPTWQGLLGASSLLGMLVGGFCFGYLTDKLGRQVMYTIDLAVIAACSVLQFFVTGVVELFVLRVIIGMAVAADYPMSSSLVTEFVPKRYRGPLLSALVCVLFLGTAVAPLIGQPLLSLGPDGWRWLLLSPVVPAVIIMLLRLGTPESPRWLVSRGRTAQAEEVLHKVYGPQVGLDALPREAPHATVATLFRRGYLGRIVFVLIFYTCSNIPLFALLTFGPKILDALGLTGSLAKFGDVAINLSFLVASVIALSVVNKMGRRRMVIWGSLLAGLTLLALGVAPAASAVLVVVIFALFSLFNGGPQILTWVYPNELFPTALRGTAVGLVTTFTRFGSAVGTYIVPVAIAGIGINVTMITAAVILFIGFGVSLRWAPETRGLALHEAAAPDVAGGAPGATLTGPQATKAAGISSPTHLTAAPAEDDSTA